MARRGNYNAHLGRTFTLTMGGQNLGVYSPMTTTWEQALTAAVVANATSLQLVLEAGAEPGNDSMALIDDVAVMMAHPHAARAVGNGNSFEYDANGNMTVRREKLDGISYVYTQTWTIDNRLASVVKSDVTGTILATTTISYDGDGVRVKKVLPRACRGADPSGATYYPSAGSGQALGVVEVLITGTNHVTTSYYAFGGAMVAMRTTATATLTYLHGDHLGSVSLTTNASGQKVSEQRYKPGACPERQRGGELRWTSGAGMPTDLTFTGQRAGSYGTIFMSAREYLPSLGRFLSADSIVPGAGNPQALNRYAYVFNSPLGSVDPDGHTPIWLQRLAGFAFQYVNDMAFGIPSAILGTDWADEESVEFQQGQQDGRSMAEIHSAILTVDGLATAAAGAAALPPTGGAVLACAAASVGTCALVGAAPVAAEVGMVVAGTVAAGIGGANLAVMGKNPVRSPNYNSGNYRKNLENRVPIPKGMKDAEAHHMLPQALRARFDQLKLGINIDDPRWLTWWEKSKHQTNSSAWRKAWDDWLDATDNPTLKQIEDQAAFFASAFGLTWP